MIELHREQYPLAIPIFAGLTHDRTVLFSVLEGTNPGRVFVDDDRAPTAALVYPQGAFIYLGGEPSDQSIDTVIHLIRDVLLPAAGERDAIIFTCSESWRTALSPILSAQGAFTIYRKTFALDENAFMSQHANWRTKVPFEMEMQRMDRKLAERMGVAGTWNSIDDFMTKGFGFYLIDGDQVVSSCSTVFVGAGEAEIDIWTAEAHRRCGLATLTAAAFIEHCLGLELRPNWACWRERSASVALARKLGFIDQEEISVILWPQQG